MDQNAKTMDTWTMKTMNFGPLPWTLNDSRRLRFSSAGTPVQLADPKGQNSQNRQEGIAMPVYLEPYCCQWHWGWEEIHENRQKKPPKPSNIATPPPLKRYTTPPPLQAFWFLGSPNCIFGATWSAVNKGAGRENGPQKSSRHFVSETGRFRVQISLCILWKAQSTILALFRRRILGHYPAALRWAKTRVLKTDVRVSKRAV